MAWTVSFYPQIYQNWKRKSVVGLNFDFLLLNIVGFTLYSSHQTGLYFNKNLLDIYFEEKSTQINPVKVNDVFFALHAIFACLVTIIQCAVYERGKYLVFQNITFEYFRVNE